MIDLAVIVEAEACPDHSRFAELAQRAAEAAMEAAPSRPTEDVAVTLLLTDDEAVRELNRSWRGQDKPTNVLSFPSSAPALPGEPRHLGDIALAFETLAREARDEGTSFEHHAAHLVVHGVLHLLGEDHETDEQASAMEGAEVVALRTLGIADPYRDRDPFA